MTPRMKAKFARINKIVRRNQTPMWKIRARSHKRKRMIADMRRNRAMIGESK
jgi:hypothetical protein